MSFVYILTSFKWIQSCNNTMTLPIDKFRNSTLLQANWRKTYCKFKSCPIFNNFPLTILLPRNVINAMVWFALVFGMKIICFILQMLCENIFTLHFLFVCCNFAFNGFYCVTDNQLIYCMSFGKAFYCMISKK